MIVERVLLAGLTELAIVAGGNFLLQGIFIAILRPSRYRAPVELWRLALAALYAGALFALLGFFVVALLGASSFELPPSPDLVLTFLTVVGLVVSGGLFDLCRGQDGLTALGVMAIGLTVCSATATAFAAAVVLREMSWFGPVFLLLGPLLVLTWCLGPLTVFLYCRQLRKSLKGQCVACGYDLRGLSEMRCPECGRPFTDVGGALGRKGVRPIHGASRAGGVQASASSTGLQGATIQSVCRLSAPWRPFQRPSFSAVALKGRIPGIKLRSACKAP